MRITISPTQEFFRTEEGYLVRLWNGVTETGLPVLAYVAAINISADGKELAKDVGMVPFPGPSAKITDVIWSES